MVVVVPTTVLLRQWQSRIVESLGLEPGLCGDSHLDNINSHRVTVYVIKSATTYLPGEVNVAARSGPVLLIADECHRYGAPTYAPGLDGPYSATLGLTATPDRPLDDSFEQEVSTRLGPVIYRCGYERALSDGVISPFMVARTALDLTFEERSAYESVSAKISEAAKKLCRIHNEVPGKALTLAQRLAKEEDDPLAKAYLALVQERAAKLYACESRTTFFQWIAANHLAPTPEPTLITVHETQTCDNFVTILRQMGVRTAAIHSNLDREAIKMTMKAFEEDALDVVISVKMLDEGIDVPGASLALIFSFPTSSRSLIQRLGRILRAAEGKPTALCILLYVRNTREEPSQRDLEDPDHFMNQVGSQLEDFSWPEQAQDLLDWIQAS